jgi:hypothetical protein
MKAGRIAQRINRDVDFCTQPAAAAPDRFSLGSLFRAGAMLMRPHNRRINHGVFIVGISRERLENALPDTALAPTGVPSMDHPRIAEPFR